MFKKSLWKRGVSGGSAGFCRLALITLALAFGGWGTSLCAQDEMLRDDHPQRYVVQTGDTLWDISGRFLRSPWEWPEIWQANPQIDNPHLIYPGDVISLVYVDGQPRLTVERGEYPTVKLSPRPRVMDLDGAISTIPLSAIEPFLERQRVLSEDEIENLPYVLTTEERSLTAVRGRKIYVKGLEGERGEQFAIARPGLVYKEVAPHFPWETTFPRVVNTHRWDVNGGYTLGDFRHDLWYWADRPYHESIDVLGYEVVVIGTGEYIRDGEVSTLLVTQSDEEIKAGDVILPISGAPFDPFFMPRAPDRVPDNTRVVSLSQALFGSGPYQVVALNRGQADGLEPGHVLAAYRPGELIRDEIAYPRGDFTHYFTRDRHEYVELPEEYAALVMVFQTFDEISYALVLEGIRPVKLYDVLRQP